eukprot:4887232-Amphidinium_carterae.1
MVLDELATACHGVAKNVVVLFPTMSQLARAHFGVLDQCFHVRMRSHMDNVTFSKFSKEDLEMANDDLIIKLVQIEQLCIEYLHSMCASAQQILQALVDKVRVQAAALQATQAGNGNGHGRRGRHASARPVRQNSREMDSVRVVDSVLRTCAAAQCGNSSETWLQLVGHGWTFTLMFETSLCISRAIVEVVHPYTPQKCPFCTKRFQSERKLLALGRACASPLAVGLCWRVLGTLFNCYVGFSLVLLLLKGAPQPHPIQPQPIQVQQVPVPVPMPVPAPQPPLQPAPLVSELLARSMNPALQRAMGANSTLYVL